MEYKNLGDINTILAHYVDGVSEKIYEAVNNIGNEGRTMLKNNSPNSALTRKKKYKSGWRTKVTHENNNIEVVIRNANAPSLTHLLENGHVGKNQYGTWGTVNASPHINKVQEYCSAKFEEDIKKIIKESAK